MRLRPVAFFTAILLVAGLAAALDGAAQPSRAQTIYVRSDDAFAVAVRKLRVSGGTIVLLPHHYRRLVVGPRSWRPLRIVGRRGVRVGSVLLVDTHRISFGGVTIGPVRGNALLEVRNARHVDLHDLVVSAQGTRRSARILVGAGRDVTIRASRFSHCGDRVGEFVNCVTLWRWTHGVVIRGNHFHDCRGCDFVHGRFGTDLRIQGNVFERALPCSMGRYRCGHNDLVQLFAGRRLRVVRNRFGVYRDGGAQLYLTNAVDHATVVNNVFVGQDPKIPGYHARVAIVVGSRRSRRMPLYARIVNNTILTGARRRDGYEGSIRMSSRYGSVRLWKRPIVANNVIALLGQPNNVCSVVQRFVQNLVIRGRVCSPSEAIGPVAIDGRGRPRPDSPAIDNADRRYAPATDATGRRRTGPPDIGAFEYHRHG